MAREPNDIFMREFFEHPGWEGVFHELNKLAFDLQASVFAGTVDQFVERKGRALGVYDAISQLKGLIKLYSKG